MTDTTLPKTENDARKTVALIRDGKQLLKYVPKGQSPKLYLDLIKSQVMKPDKYGNERQDSDLLLFLYVAKRTGLDPLTKQIYAVFRWDSKQGRDVMSIQAGIDGMRLVAQRTGQYAGQDDAVMLPADESTEYPTKATVTIYKLVGGQKVAFSASARWTEYAPKNAKGEVEFMWRKMPYTMLAKCAEALALRKGFPNELSGIYSEEELSQANPTPAQEIATLPEPDKFKDKKIVVAHGAPQDNSATPVPAPKVTPENVGQYAPAMVEDSVQMDLLAGTALTPPAKPAAKIEGTETSSSTAPKVGPGDAVNKLYEPDLGAMREAIKPKLTVTEMKERMEALRKTKAVK